MPETDPTPRPVEAGRPSARHLAWFSIPAFVTVAAAVYALHSAVVYESALLQTTLSTLFRASVSLLIAYLAARTYLVSGSRAVLALGCGALALGTASLLAGLLMADPNAAVTAHNSGFCLAGACFLLSAGWAVRPRQAASSAAPLAFSYLAVPVAVGLVAGGALTGVMPGFVGGAHGYTSLRQATLGLAVLEFALASLCFVILYARSRTPFLKWYGIGLALAGTGLLLNMVEGSPGTALSWVARSGQYLGGLYMLAGIMTAADGRWGWRIPLEQALHESEGRYQMLVESSPDAIVVHRDGRFLYVNPAGLRLYGAADLRQLNAYKVLDLIVPAERAQADAAIRQAYAGGALPMRERRLLRLDGSQVAVEMLAAPIMYQGAPAMQAVLRNISARKQAEAEREQLLRAERQARAQADAALQLRDEFLSVAAHEFRTPITSVRGHAQLLVRRIDRGTVSDVQQVRAALEVIDREADRLARLEEQLLDVSRLQGDGLVLDRQVTDIASLIREVVEAMQLASRQPLRLHAPSSLAANVDPLRLNQVVVNLIDNARKFAPAGSCVEVELTTFDAHTVCLCVRDHGPGIPPAERERLFSRYHRAGTRRPAGGMGLGLYISRKIVEAHGGHIEPDFPPEGGTRFVVTLPRATTEAPTEST